MPSLGRLGAAPPLAALSAAGTLPEFSPSTTRTGLEYSGSANRAESPFALGYATSSVRLDSSFLASLEPALKTGTVDSAP